MFKLHSLLRKFLIMELCVSLAKINAGPLTGRTLDPEISAGKFEGDMILTEKQLRFINSETQSRNGLVAETKRWPNRIVYYKIAGNFDTSQRQGILEGIARIESRTCIRFREASESQPHYLKITSDPGGCYTTVGYLGKIQQMNLETYPVNEGCFRTGTILHEFMHALGFYHQQSDANRDDYVEVLYENIIPGKEFNFEKYKSSEVTDFDMGYDYESCLHYGATAFSTNGKETLMPLKSTAKIGQRVNLSEKDITKINIMYKCPIFI